MASKRDTSSDGTPSDSAPSDKQRDLQHDRPSVTNRAWGTSHDPGDQSFGYPGQGGYGDFRTRDIDDAPVMDAPARGASGDQQRARPDDREVTSRTRSARRRLSRS